MSNKTKIDISNSKRPLASEINVFDEYNKRENIPNYRRVAINHLC